MNRNSPASGTDRRRASAADGQTRWFRGARSGATLALFLYVVVWSALLGDFADNLTVGQDVSGRNSSAETE